MISDKQMKILAFPYTNYDALICDGAVRSGKTSIMMWAFVAWAMENFSGQRFGICGKTVDSCVKNIIVPFTSMPLAREKYIIRWKRLDKVMEVRQGNVTNYFEIFGGRDESSAALIQGRTLAGVLMDEVVLMPRSFVEQALARCSVDGARLWFSCNPSSPFHWFYTDWIKRADEHNALYLHFEMTDNPSLSEKTIERYNTMYSGIFYDRYVRGLWVAADGIIYDCFTSEKNTYTAADRDEKVPVQVRENDTAGGGAAIYGCDYGVFNPCVYLEGYKIRKQGDSVPYFYIDNEYYYDGRKSMRQRSDEEYAGDFVSFSTEKHYKGIYVDPSASSLIVALRKKGVRVMRANNDVEEGIKKVYTLMSTGHILINADRCKHLIAEIGLYAWNEKRSENGKEEPVKSNDHCCDALRYLINSTTASYEVFK